jgi:hypothetical protein
MNRKDKEDVQETTTEIRKELASANRLSNELYEAISV